MKPGFAMVNFFVEAVVTIRLTERIEYVSNLIENEVIMNNKFDMVPFLPKAMAVIESFFSTLNEIPEPCPDLNCQHSLDKKVAMANHAYINMNQLSSLIQKIPDLRGITAGFPVLTHNQAEFMYGITFAKLLKVTLVTLRIPPNIHVSRR